MRKADALLILGGVIWVGGGGFLMFRYPEFFATINARVGLTRAKSPQFISLAKKVGIVEMVLAGLSVIAALLSIFLGRS